MSDSRYYEKSETDTLLADKVSKSDIVQSTGTSTTAVMSQKAVSDKLNDLQQKIDNADADVRGFFKIENVFLITTNKWYNSPSNKSIFYPVNSPT